MKDLEKEIEFLQRLVKDRLFLIGEHLKVAATLEEEVKNIEKTIKAISK